MDGDRLLAEVEVGLGWVHPSLRARFRIELERVAPSVADGDIATLARVRLAMLVVADGSLQRLLVARDGAERDWHDLLLQASPDGRGPSKAQPVTTKTSSQARTGPKSRDLVADLGAGGSVLVGFWENAAQFVSPNDGRLTAIPPDAWFTHPDDVGDEILPGDYGDLLADEHHIVFERHGIADLWHPGRFEVTRDQRTFRLKTKKGHAVDHGNDVEVLSVIDDQNLAHRFAAEGYLVRRGSSAIGMLIGSSLEDWHLANRR